MLCKTMKIIQKCAQECGQKYGVVTYDLNTAKLAIQIQITESPNFNDIFIMLAPFTSKCFFFKVLGKLIDSSGGKEVLKDSDELTSGSWNGFLGGKHFNRCKCL